MMFSKNYDSKIRYQNQSVLSCKFDELMEIDDPRFPKEFPIIKAFLEDEDIREITIVSTCVGFVKTFTKLNCKGSDEKQST